MEKVIAIKEVLNTSVNQLLMEIHKNEALKEIIGANEFPIQPYFDWRLYTSQTQD